MAFKVTLGLVCCIAATISALPIDNDVEGEVANVYSEHKLSGASGTFRYPLSGSKYKNNERVLITARFPENTVFIFESIATESTYDTVNFHKWVGDDLVLAKTYAGHYYVPKYFLTEGNFLITFESDDRFPGAGFNFRWAPLETI